MNNRWRLIRSPAQTGSVNMQADLDQYQRHENGETIPLLRLYSWRPKCLSLGYSQSLKSLDLALADQLGWQVVKRPTGGGIVFHNEAEVTYSLILAKEDPLLPKGLVPAYKRISGALVRALKSSGVNAEITGASPARGQAKPQLCFSYPAEYEVVVNGKKVVGSAQKRGKRTLLQQGSIFVRRTDPQALRIVRDCQEDILAASLEELLGRTLPFNDLAKAIIRGFQETFGIEFDEEAFN